MLHDNAICNRVERTSKKERRRKEGGERKKEDESETKSWKAAEMEHGENCTADFISVGGTKADVIYCWQLLKRVIREHAYPSIKCFGPLLFLHSQGGRTIPVIMGISQLSIHSFVSLQNSTFTIFHTTQNFSISHTWFHQNSTYLISSEHRDSNFTISHNSRLQDQVRIRFELKTPDIGCQRAKRPRGNRGEKWAQPGLNLGRLCGNIKGNRATHSTICAWDQIGF